MRLNLTFVLLFFSTWVYCQIQDPNWKNLIPNYSFEVVSSNYPVNLSGGIGPTGEPEYYCHGGAAINDYDNWIKGYWNEVYEWTHPLRTNSLCAIWHGVAVGTADVLRDFNGSTYARSGLNRGHGTSGEFLVVPLWHGGIKQGKTYFVEVFRKSSELSPSHLYLSQGQPRQCGNNDLKSLSNGLLVKIMDLESNTQGWHRTKGYVTLPFDFNWAAFGHEDIGGEWDDLRIYEVQKNGCRDNWYFDNTVFNYPFEFFQATDKIYVGNGVDPENGVNHIPGDVIVYAGTEVVLQAGNQVIIENVFEMEEDAILVIENTPCNDNLCPEELSFEDEILCDIPSLQIGTTPNPWGTSVSWSPSTHLDNPNVANPTFTAPSGTGTVNYTVQVTYTCDGGFEYTSSYPVTIQYTDNNNPNATVSATNTNWDVYNFSTDFSLGDGVTELTISVNTAPGYQETFYVGTDFTGNTFSWELPDAWRWSSCHDDEIIVTARNGCLDIEQTLTLDWLKSQIPFQFQTLPNVITPNDDGINDVLCFNLPSADFYDLVVTNNWGQVMYSSSGEINNLELCTWAPAPYSVTEGTYFYILTVSDLCGNSQQANQHFQVVMDNNGLIKSSSDELNQLEEDFKNSNDSINNEAFSVLTKGGDDEKSTVQVYPNPSNGNFLVYISNLNSAKAIYILDNLGKQIDTRTNLQKENHFDKRNLNSGVYIVEVVFEDKVVRKKIVIK